MTKHARFEVCRSGAGWWARFVAGNGAAVWVTELYTRRASAMKAVASLLAACEGDRAVVVRVVDERVKS